MTKNRGGNNSSEKLIKKKNIAATDRLIEAVHGSYACTVYIGISLWRSFRSWQELPQAFRSGRQCLWMPSDKYRNTRRKTHIVFCSTEAQIQMATKRSNQIFRAFNHLVKSKRTDHSLFNLSNLTNAKHKPHCPNLYLYTSDVVTSAVTE